MMIDPTVVPPSVESFDLRSIPSYKASKICWWLMCEQSLTGICFARDKAEALLVRIAEEMKAIADEIEPQLPPRPLKKGEQSLYTFPMKPYKKDGTLSAHGLNFLERHGLEVIGINHVEWPKGSGKLVKIEGSVLLEATAPMMLNEQSDDLKNWFLEMNWVPTMWNYRKDKNGKNVRDEKGKLIPTSPKIHEKGIVCPNLFEVAGDFGPLIKKIATFFSLKNRNGVVNGWVNHPRLEVDGRLPAGASGITPTHRSKHRVVCNVPKAEEDVVLGKEMRSLFVARPGRVLVGIDAAALENRVEAHYCYRFPGGPEYAAEVLDGDPHSKNAFAFFPRKLELLGLTLHPEIKEVSQFKPFRSKSKSGKYCLSYGGSAPKLAQTLGIPQSECLIAYDNFWEANLPLKMLKETLIKFWETTGEKKWIKGIDGRKIMVRSKHSLVNFLFQSCGAVVIEYAGIFLNKWLGGIEIDEEGCPGYFYKGHWVYRVITMHDEFQMDSPEEIADEVGKLGVRSIVKAGEYLKMKVPMDGASAVSDSWAGTH